MRILSDKFEHKEEHCSILIELVSDIKIGGGGEHIINVKFSMSTLNDKGKMKPELNGNNKFSYSMSPNDFRDKAISVIHTPPISNDHPYYREIMKESPSVAGAAAAFIDNFIERFNSEEIEI